MGAYTHKDLIATAYYSYSSSILARVAKILGHEQDEAYYSGLSEKVGMAFNEEFVTPNGRLVSLLIDKIYSLLDFNHRVPGKISERDQKSICFRQGFLIIIKLPVVKKAVCLTFIKKQITPAPHLFHDLFIILNGFHRNELIFSSKENNSWRGTLPDIVQGRKNMVSLSYSFKSISTWSVVYNRVKEHQGVRNTTD